MKKGNIKNKIQAIINKVKFKFQKEKKENDEEMSSKKKRIKKQKNKRIKFRFGYWLLVLIITFGLICFVSGIGFFYYIVKSAPEFNLEKMFEKESTKIFDSKGRLIATLGSEQREKVTYEQLPQVLVDAILATEDSRFFQHNGFDAPRFLKASASQVLGKGGGGASTLTMQLSKLAFTSTETTGFEGIIRKFTDIYMSVFKMEKNLTKYQIIEYYVNTPCLGGNIYGVQQASKYYFNKDVKDLNLVQAAMIAGLFQSPNGYNPYFNPEDSNERKNTVLYLMKRHGYITDDEYNAAVKIHVKDILKNGINNSNTYQGFIDTVVEEVINKTGNDPYDVPMIIYTTMDRDKQDVINDFYKNHEFKDSKVEAGIAVIDNDTGAIVAVGAGRNKNIARGINVASFNNQIKRHPGSTIKPILDYGPAIEYENLSTYGPFIDDKTPYGSGSIINFNYTYSGFRTMEYCLGKSLNTCALQAFNMTTSEQKYDFATSLGLTLPVKDKNIPASYSIGAFNGVSPIELAGAYSAFGNGGYFTKPHSFTKLVYIENDEEFAPMYEKKKVMKPQTAYLITSVLRGTVPSFVRVSGTQLAAKTGTSSYDTSELRKYGLSQSVIPDGWTVTYSAKYSVAIWYGYKEWLTQETVKNKWYLLNGPAITERQKIQKEINNKIHPKNVTFKNPGGITTASVELETIPPSKPSAYTPSKLKGTFMFISGTEPSETSVRFAKLSNPSDVTFNITTNNIELSWSSPSTPQAIDKTFLEEYFKKGYTRWADKYLGKRLTYNKDNIGSFGFEIYLTSGTNSKFISWTDKTTYNIDLNKYSGTYDGVIIKSVYSKFKSNASDGIKILFNQQAGKDYNVTINNNSITLYQDDIYNSLTTDDINSITYDSNDIKSSISDLTISIKSITKDGKNIDISNVTKEIGTYIATYSVSFKYNSNNVTKNVTQTIIVNKKN